ncbi:hypothetical protein T492DRAFT_1101684 [Pavlovales sp. CCMP2436]|nr:hypothetical protein T492DRAFT_1101684 [Pavlovales sp. CCMP2436]
MLCRLLAVRRWHATPLQSCLLRRGGSCHICCLRPLSLIWYPPASVRHLLLSSSPPSAAPPSPVQPPPLPATASTCPTPPRSARHRGAEQHRAERDAAYAPRRWVRAASFFVGWDLVQIASAGSRCELRDIAVSVPLAPWAGGACASSPRAWAPLRPQPDSPARE